ncbi:nucleoside triphosphate pyrophosphohydrolase [Lihuaxuella thermophila]|uniref:Predicted house-cleaning noncanonical NTP pyrophosphatase, all-alpha NTP-PPase (MazG) superfamily n=1 Tax=Lihuaxuella thermophila TaxID=1173111 RepID=A0A1H8CEG0_9BACL|nr:nucleoside triphosphate pyrophosphohydrolase [Lihuaxuella thermophila]SEM93406.1 Predicted house-cleaning noncanonical NTP pyrophosphatase, all-alpha NTP-PPase (MazG) superfamily [Lihuaxuella thermophila]
MAVYNKLIRDKIPEIIAASNKEAVIRTLTDHEYMEEAKKKLYEELEEYKAAVNDREALEELADIMELIYALAAVHGSSKEGLEEIRLSKAEKRGGFAKKLFLVEVKE